MEKFINYNLLELPTEEIGNFKAYRDYHTNAIFWDNGEATIYASPEWEGEQGICALQIVSNEDCSEGYEYFISTPYDLPQQVAEYIEIVTQLIEGIESKSYEDFDSILSNNLKIHSI